MFFFFSKFLGYFIFHRISLTLSCPMNLKLFPLDRQTCSLSMGSCELFIFYFISVRRIFFFNSCPRFASWQLLISTLFPPSLCFKLFFTYSHEEMSSLFEFVITFFLTRRATPFIAFSVFFPPPFCLLSREFKWTNTRGVTQKKKCEVHGLRHFSYSVTYSSSRD